MHSTRAWSMDGQRHLYEHGEALSDGVATRLIALCNQRHRGRRWHVALCGGRTPVGIYARLRARQAEIDWASIEVWFGDERDVGPEHPQSNYRMARETLLAHVPIPPGQVHPMRRLDLDLRRECARYARWLDLRLPKRDGWPSFDLILLGLGSDGHTASLFPGTCILHALNQTVAPVYVPQLQTWRMSLTLPVLGQAERLLFAVTGADKAEALEGAWQPPRFGNELPVHRIHPRGEVEWHVDRAAAEGRG